MVMDNSGKQYLAELIELNKRITTAKILEEIFVEEGLELKQAIFVYQAIPKNLAKLELVLQKCTELGVRGFYPLITKRTELHSLRNIPRLEAIIKEAAEQCGAVRLPLLSETVKIQQVIKRVPSGLNLVAYEKETATSLHDLNKKIKESERINIFIGPEGGFDETEIEELKKAGATSVALGKRILRTETAALAMVSAICLF